MSSLRLLHSRVQYQYPELPVSDVWSVAMARHHMHILVGHGDLLEGWFLHSLTWISASDLKVGIIGARLRMKELLAFMSTGIYDLVVTCFHRFRCP